MSTNYIEKAREIVGSVQHISDACGVDPRAVRRWIALGRLPNSAFSGETAYAEAIAKLTKNKVTKKQLLSLDYWKESKQGIEDKVA